MMGMNYFAKADRRFLWVRMTKERFSSNGGTVMCAANKSSLNHRRSRTVVSLSRSGQEKQLHRYLSFLCG
jgi:hypothetical protein